MRTDKLHYYLDIASTVATRSTCLRRQYGAVIVKNDEIIATGYNGAPRGCVNCIDTGYCKREEMQIPHNERYELCRSVHAEQNALLSAARRDTIGATLYLSCTDCPMWVSGAECCDICKKLIMNAGISHVIIRDNAQEQRIFNVEDWKI